MRFKTRTKNQEMKTIVSVRIILNIKLVLVHGPCSRAVLDTLVTNADREHGPWTRVVYVELYHQNRRSTMLIL